MKSRIRVAQLVALAALAVLAIGSFAALYQAHANGWGASLQWLGHAIAGLRRGSESPPETAGAPGPAATAAGDLFAKHLAVGSNAFSYGTTVTPKLIVHDESREVATIAFFKYSNGFANHMIQGRARGNVASPKNVEDHDVVAQYSGQGYFGGAFQKVGAVNMQVDARGDLDQGMTGKLVFKVAGTNAGSHTFDTAVEMDRRLRTVFEGAIALRYTTQDLIHSDQNDYELGDQRTSVYRLASDAPHAISGFVATKDIDSPAGEMITLINVGRFDLLLHNQSPRSLEPNRIITGTGRNLKLRPDQMATLFYDHTSARWRLLSTTGG